MRKAVPVLLLTASCLFAQTQAFAQSPPADDGGPAAHGGPGDRSDRGRPDGPPSADQHGRPGGPGPAGKPGGPGGPERRDAANGPLPHRDWHRGDRLPPDYRGPQYVIDDWRGYDLQPPPSGYQWVQVDGNFVLAAIATGVITSIVLAPHR